LKSGVDKGPSAGGAAIARRPRVTRRLVATSPRSTILLSSAVALFAGCVAEVPGEDLGAALEPLRVCADGPTVAGIDVSHWQGEIDWDRVAGAGVGFAIIRVADGTGTLDRQWGRNWPEARRVGILRGAYQYFRPDQDPIAQADLFLEHMGPLEDEDIAPVIDVETTGGRSPSQIAAAVRRWIDRVEAATGRAVLIYTGKYFWQDQVGGSPDFGSNGLWVAQWGPTCPDIPGPWPRWDFWQTSATGRVAGIDGDVDTDVFNGSIDELRGYGRVRCEPGCDGDALVGEDCDPRPCGDAARCVADDLGARCVAAACPDRGVAAVCLDEQTVGRCEDGALTPADCGALAGLCSTAGRAATEARCVSALCVADPEAVPVAHDGCWLEGAELLHCDGDGQPTTEACPEGEACSMVGGAARCVSDPLRDPGDPRLDPGDPPPGEPRRLLGSCSAGGRPSASATAAPWVLALAFLFGVRRRRR